MEEQVSDFHAGFWSQAVELQAGGKTAQRCFSSEQEGHCLDWVVSPDHSSPPSGEKPDCTETIFVPVNDVGSWKTYRY